MKKVANYLIATMLVVLVANLMLIGSAKAPAAPVPAVKIGAILPLTGFFSKEGPKFKKGIELALDQAGWEVAGRKIELIIEDSATDANTARDKVTKLIVRDKVPILIGPLHSGVRIAIMPYIEANKVPNLTVREDPIDIIEKFNYEFAVNGTLKQHTYRMGDYAYDVLGYKTVNVLAPDYVAGHVFCEGFMDRFKKKGGTILQERYFPVGTVDFAPYLTTLKKSDACAVWVAGPGALRLVRQYEEYGLFKKMPMIAAYQSGIFDEDVLPEHGDTALGISGPIDYASTIDTPLNKRFVEDYRQKHTGRPSSTCHGGYIATLVALEALKATGGDTAPEKLREAILGLRMEGPTGPISFTPKGISIHTTFIVENSKVNGEYLWKVVHTYPDTAPPGR